MTLNTQNTEDETTDDAIVDITRSESDDLISSEEAQLHAAFAPSQLTFKQKISHALQKWWKNKIARYAVIGGLVLLLGLTTLSAPLRNGVLNTVGVRGSLEVTIIDKTNNTPLQNVQIEIAGQSTKTARSGKVTIRNIKLGMYELTVRKSAFATTRVQVSIGMADTTLSKVTLHAVGAQYGFLVTDYLTGKPVVQARVHSLGDASANANTEGKIVLTITAQNEQPISVTVSSDGYKDVEAKISVGDKNIMAVVLVPKVRHLFISNQSGTLGVYGVDIDGKNRTPVVATITANSSAGLQLRSKPESTLAALVSKKDDVTNSDGYQLDALTILDTSTRSSKTIDRGESIQIIGWSKDSLIYQLVSSGVSAANVQRSKLISYDAVSGKKSQLASANYFTGIELIDSQIYYTVSATDPGMQSSLMQIGIDGKNRQLLVKDNIWGIYRKTYTTLSLQTPTSWLSYDTSIHKASRVAVADYQVVRYSENADASQNIHIENRDGKNVVIVATSASDEKVLQAPNANSVSWLTKNIIIVRSVSQNETADYALNINGGMARKITDSYPN